MTPDRSALDLIRASITAHEAKADEARDAGRYRISTDHHAIAAGLRIAEAHILANPDAELDASQRRAVRIQQLLDDTRDRSRKDAAASRESARQLQQQIERQAKEIDRLRDDRATLARVRTELDAIKTEAQLMNPYDRDPVAELERIRAALEPPKETS